MHSRFSVHSYKLILVLGSTTYCSFKCCEHEKWNIKVFKIVLNTELTANMYTFLHLIYITFFRKIIHLLVYQKHEQHLDRNKYKFSTFFFCKTFLFLRFKVLTIFIFCRKTLYPTPMVNTSGKSEYQVSRV